MRWIYRISILIGLLAQAGVAGADDAEDVFRHSRIAVLGNAMALPESRMHAALSWLANRGKTDVAAALILALRYNRSLSEPISSALSRPMGIGLQVANLMPCAHPRATRCTAPDVSRPKPSTTTSIS